MLVIYDLETLRDFFLYVDVDLENNFHIFEISKFKNDLVELREHLNKVKGQIGFNNVSFDAQVQEYFLRNYKSLMQLETNEEAAQALHDYAQHVIEIMNGEGKWPDYREKDFSIKQADLFRIFHYNNKGKSCSLKWLQYSMDWSPIEDMPIDHNSSISTREQADKIIEYCKNDCLSTKAFYKIARGETTLELYKGKDKFQLRKDIKKEFGFDCTNFDDVKIGDQINKVNYLKSTGLEWEQFRSLRHQPKSFTFGDCFPSYMEFKTKEMRDIIETIRNVVVSVDEKQKFPFIFYGNKYVIAKGGLHTEDKSRILRPLSNEILRDADVGSMYPRAIVKRSIYPEHLGPKWLDGYSAVMDKRIEAKHAFKKTGDPKFKSIDEALKLALNGGSFGKMGSKESWQYSPHSCFKITIGSQIDLLMLIESLEINGIKVMSANTDGVLCLFSKDKDELYMTICEDWEKKVGNYEAGRLEYANYQLLAQRSVNDYIAVPTEEEIVKNKAKNKYKGDSFTIDAELHRNKSYRVISLALNEFYTKGINPRLFITNHSNIFDFCAGVRTKGDWFLEARGVFKGNYLKKRLQKTNRYYISNNGFKLVKCHIDGREIKEDTGKWLSTIYNKHVDKSMKDYDLNYEFYVEETYKIISEIQPEIINEHYQQLRLF